MGPWKLIGIKLWTNTWELILHKKSKCSMKGFHFKYQVVIFQAQNGIVWYFFWKDFEISQSENNSE